MADQSTPIAHAWVQENGPAFLLGGLSPEEQTQLRAHLTTCDMCAADIQHLQEDDAMLQRMLSGLRADGQFENRLAAAFHATTKPPRLLFHPSTRRLGIGAAAFLALGATGLVAQYLVTSDVLNNPMSRYLAESSPMPADVWAPHRAERSYRAAVGASVTGILKGASTYGIDGPQGGAPSPQDALQHGLVGQSSDSPRRLGAGGGGSGGKQLSPIEKQLMQNTRTAYDSQKYEEAADNLKKVLAINPQNGDAALMLQIVKDRVQYRSFAKFGKKRSDEYSADDPKSAQDWPTITRRRITDDAPSARRFQPQAGKSADGGALAEFPTESDKLLKDVKELEAAQKEMKKAVAANASIDNDAAKSITDSSVESGRQSGKQFSQKSDTGITPAPVDTDLVELSAKYPDAVAGQPGAPGAATMPGDSSAAASASPTQSQAAANQKIIRNGQMEFEVKSFDDAFATMSSIATEEAGFIASTNSEKLPNGKIRGTVVVRVPPEHLDRVILKLRSLGELKTQTIAAQDITKDYTDLESALRANRAMQDRLIDLIKNGKGEVKDLVEAEKQLGVYREKIEQIEGQIRYDDSLIALSTLTVTCYEKDIAVQAAAAEIETVNMGVETEDVESKYTDAKAGVASVGGRIIQADLKHLEAGQLLANISAEVPADKVDEIALRFKGLGRMVRFDRDRHQVNPNSATPVTQNTKIEEKPAQITLALYNLANVAPRTTTTLTLAVADVEAAYKKAQELITAQPKGDDAKPGKVIAAAVSGQSTDQQTADVRADLPTATADSLITAIRGLGEVATTASSDNPDTANVTSAKHGLVLRLVAITSIAARESTTMTLAAADVADTYRTIGDKLATIEGTHTLTAQLLAPDSRSVTGTLDVEIPRTAKPAFDAFLAGLPLDIPAKNITRSTDTANTLDSKVHYALTLTSAANLPPRQTVTLAIEVPDVDKALADLRTTYPSVTAKELDSANARDESGRVSAHVLLDVPLRMATMLDGTLAGLGKERTNQLSRDPNVPEGNLTRARYDITLSNTALLVPQNTGLTATIRAALSNSLAILLWSLYLIVSGILMIGPWLLLGWIGWKIFKPRKKLV